MSIQRTDINGSITVLKAALETLVPDFFASVEYDDAVSPTTVICKDSDNNTLMTVQGNSTAWLWKVYKNESTSIEYGSSSNAAYAQPNYFYSVGSNGAVIVCGTQSQLILIAKTNTEVTGLALPVSSPSTVVSKFQINPTCWGDDSSLTEPLFALQGSNISSGIGNHTFFVPVPLHGTYNQNIYLLKAFFMPMVQTGMRGVVQELSADEGVYISNGYIALLDDGGEA